MPVQFAHHQQPAALLPSHSQEDLVSQSDDDDGDDDNEEDIDLGEEDQQESGGCLRFYVDLKDQGPMISWTSLCSSLEGSDDNGDAMEVDDAEESVSQGSYYDVNDPFIDDSELFDVEQSKRIETEMKGFFVQTGDIAVVEKKQRPKASKQKSKPIIRPATPEVDEYTNKEKVVINGQVDEVLTDELTSLRDLINSNHDKLTDSEKKSMPVALETALMNFEERIQTIKATGRKHVYAQLIGLFPAGSFLSKGNIKDKMKKMYIQWLPKKFEAQSKKVIRRLKLKVKKDTALFEAAVQSGDTSAGCISVSKKADGKLKYRCRWDLFAPDLLELSTIARDFTNAFNTTLQHKSTQKSKLLDCIQTVAVNEDVVRRKYFKQILESWPNECSVTSIHLNDAYKRYKIKNENTGAATGIATDKDSPTRRASLGFSVPTNIILQTPASVAVSALLNTHSTNGVPEPVTISPIPIELDSVISNDAAEMPPLPGIVFDSPPPSPFAEHLRRVHPSGQSATGSDSFVIIDLV